MAEKTEVKPEVKTETPPTEVAKDERGIPWEQRAKEFERKYTELQNEVKEAKVVPPVPQEELDAANKKDLIDLAQDPRGFVARMVAEDQTRKERSEVLPYLQSQKGYTPEDNARLVQIETEYDLRSPSPLIRARTAWTILQKEKLETEVSKRHLDSDRKEAIDKTMPEGSGKTVPKTNAPKRADLLVQLAKAEAKGDFQNSARLIDLLSDVKE